MPARPEIRANWSKHSVRCIRQLPDDKRGAVLAKIGDDTLGRIRRAGVLTWLPAEHHGRLLDAVRSVLSHWGAISFWRDAMYANLHDSMLRPLVQGGIHLFGGTVYSVIRMSPRAWSLVTRNCGTHLVSRGEGRVELRIRFVGLPPMLATQGFIAHAIGNCDAVLRLLTVKGTTAVVEEQLGASQFTLEVADVRPEVVGERARF
jgi:hypothetical protein